MNAWAQEPVGGAPAQQGDQALQNATESQVKELWRKLQVDSVELEATDPRGAITRYQGFFEAGGGRFASVGVQIALRIARLWQIDLKNYDKAIEIYDWALGTYRNEPDAVLLQQGRLAAEQTQKRAEAAQEKKGPGLSNVPEVAPLAVPVPQLPDGGRLGINIPSSTEQGKFGIHVPASTGQGKLGIGIPLSANGGKMGIGISSVGNSKSLAIAAPPVRGNALGWKPGPERCVTALAQGPDGNLWVATEDSGVWCYNPSAARSQDRWQQFTATDGLGDDSTYALAVDRQGRVWAGTLNHGVSVWNGKEWKNYGVLDGPLGERVFAIKTCPTDGDVWIATNAGLTRYSQQKDSWSHFTRGDGLPSDQIQAIAFDQSGNILLGTQCDGVALAQAADGYKTWRVMTGPEEMPVTATGKGLPSSLINDVLVAKDGTFYAATTTGLAWSSDRGESWAYVRGQDYAAKVQGLYGGPPADWKEESGAVLAEDYVSCLSQDKAGRIWLGHWQAGSEMVQMQRGPTGLRVKAVSYRQDNGLVRAILPQGEGAPLLARYDEGLSYNASVREQGIAITKPGVADAVGASVPSLPTAAKAPTPAELNALLASLSKIKHLDLETPVVVALAGDWTTQGNWLGRYGHYWADLCAMISPYDLIWGSGAQPIEFKWSLGANHRDGDSGRYWVHTLQTDDPRVLEMTPMYGHSRLVKGFENDVRKLRRQSELDDHGEDYPITMDGPHLRQVLKVPAGVWVLSLYNRNKDGHLDLNRMRDYFFSIRPHDPKLPLSDTSDFDHQTELARSRQHDFWEGEWKRFFVQGPQELTIEINRNYSRNTIVAGAFLDPLDEEPYPYFNLDTGVNKKSDNDVLRSSRLQVKLPANEAAENLWMALETARRDVPYWWCSSSRPFYIALGRYYQAARSQTPSDQMNRLRVRLGTCFRSFNLMSDWEQTQRERGLVPARDIERAIRWDGRYDDRGAGFESVVAYSTAKAGLDWWEKNK